MLEVADKTNPRSTNAGISILLLTKDEEQNIFSCLQRLTFSDDIVVLDSYSTDCTLDIVCEFPNVRVIQHNFDNFSRHRNWALENILFKHPWVYVCDADEHVTPELRDEILRVISDAARPHVAYRLRYKNVFMGRWLRHGGIYPVWVTRLFKTDCVSYEDREVNAHPVIKGSTGELQEHFIHYSFNKGLVPWFQKHNSYSQMEANEAVRVRQGHFRGHLRNAFSGEWTTNRRAIKNISFYIPFRDVARFFYMYIFKLGILDGLAGFHYANMISMYEYWITLKIFEQEHSWMEQNEKIVRQLLTEPHS